MIHPDCATGATAISDTAAMADQLGRLADVVGDLTVMVGIGLVLAMRELQLHQITAELESAR